MRLPTYLDRYPAVHAQDSETARHGLISIYGADGFDTNAPNFGLRANYASLANSGLAFCAYDGAASVSFPESGLVRQFFSIQGRARLRSRRLDAPIGPWTRVVGGDSRLGLHFEEGYRQLVLRLDHSALERMLKALVGDSSDRRLQFDEEADPDPVGMNVLRQHVFHLAAELDLIEAARSPLAIAEFERGVMVRFFLANKHNFGHFFDREPLRANPAVVQRVESFVEQNWDRPIELSELAAVANVSVRTIFREFERAGKGSPAQFAKRIRLDRAAGLLAEPEADTTVTGVALRCGFQNLGRFSADYFRTFGELPSETLRRGRTG
ncbi:MAG: AraC family transcriptional regulator [Bradyrhizobium sp.]|nr:AraC family transcriptional regulator [Bradyrhizobium sp.]